MKTKLLLLAVFCGMSLVSFAADDGKDAAEILRKSNLGLGSFPQPFTAFPTIDPANNNRPIKSAPAVSTGYYMVDSDDEAGDAWRPSLFKAYTNLETDLQNAVERVKWRRIVSGPRQSISAELQADGKPFFRNPNALTVDSSDNAIAGPIKIGFPFFFNGVKYDSFYVSTNGLVALSNPRYTYDASGARIIPPGSSDAYNFYREDNIAANTYGGARPKSGDGLTDGTADDYGWRFVATGNTSSTTGGLRNPTNTPMAALPADLRWSPLVAPMWNDLQCSQDDTRADEEKGQVWYKRADNPNGTRRLIIYFKNFNLRAVQNYRFGTVNFPLHDNRIRLNFQVTLDESDSSVYMYYEDLSGIVVAGSYVISAPEFVRMNSAIGVSGMSRHYGFQDPNCLSNVGQTEYITSHQQSSQFLNDATWNGSNINVQGSGAGSGASAPASGLAIRLKQWKNVVRVVPSLVSYLGRALNATAPLNEYPRVISGAFVELLAGHPQLGAIRPVAVFQNLTNNIQGPGIANPPRPSGVNYQRQDVNFRTRFRIVNQATNQTAYSETVPISRSCLLGNCIGTTARVEYGSANSTGTTFTPAAFPGTGPCPMNGIPPYGLVRVSFPPFQPNELIDFNIGRLRAFVIAEPIDTLFRTLGDQWPFDDTVKLDLFVMRRLSFLNFDGFNDDVTEYHVIGGNPMPSVLKWVNIDAEVVDGEQNTYNPVPPRGRFAAKNRPTYFTESPAIRMNRRTLADAEPNPNPGGDELRSFPIDVRNLPNRPTTGAVLSVSVERTGVPESPLDRGWADNTLLGPEPRVIYNGVRTNIYNGGGAINPLDEFYVEYARPSNDEIENIARQAATDIEWNVHRRRDGQTVTNNPVFTLYGGGGLTRGYFETDKDSVLTAAQGLRSDPFDDGRDREFNKLFFPLPLSVIEATNNGGKNFRFRLRVKAKNNAGAPGQPIDDKDDYYVDNIRLIYSEETPDIEMVVSEVLWPYTITPASQMQQVPVRYKIVNNTNVQSGTVKVSVEISPDGDNQLTSKVYCRNTLVPFVRPGQEISSTLPAWNASKSAPAGRYRVMGFVQLVGGDLDPTNDTTYSLYQVNYGPVFAYAPTSATNDVPTSSQASGAVYPGRGLGMFGRTCWAWPNYATAGDGGCAFGEVTGTGSGQIAMMYETLSQDTLKGFQVWFGGLNQSPDPISFSVYSNLNGVPGTRFNNSDIVRERGVDNTLPPGSLPVFDAYSTYLLDRPLLLQPGRYWISVAQLGLDNFCLGASQSRMGQIITNYNDTPPGTWGTSGFHLNLDKSFRNSGANGNGYGTNRNVFAYENTRFSGTWQQFTPMNNPGYGHLAHVNGAQIGGYATFSRGSWLPLLRPFFGNKQTVSRLVYDENCTPPVELTYFDGQKRSNAVDLFWQTASEDRNAGFEVERRIVNNGSLEEWQRLGFVPGSGTTSSARNYNFTDNGVERGTTYQYRLMQYDVDGGETCQNVGDILEFTFDDVATSTFAANLMNVPNPFNSSTTISFTLPQTTNVKLVVQDAFGNVVRNLFEGSNSGQCSYEWNGTDNQGNNLASGVYIYRLEANGQMLTGKMTLAR